MKRTQFLRNFFLLILPCIICFWGLILGWYHYRPRGYSEWSAVGAGRLDGNIPTPDAAVQRLLQVSLWSL